MMHNGGDRPSGGFGTRRFGSGLQSGSGWLSRSSGRRRADGRLVRSARRVGQDRAVVSGRRGFIVARWKWIALITLVSIGAAVFVSWSQTPTYRATAEVLVQPRLFSAGTAPQVPDMGTEKSVATSGAVLHRASQIAGVPIAQLSHGLSVSVPLNTTVLQVAYSSPDPAQAQRRAQAVAEAYTSYSQAQQPTSRSLPRTAAGEIVGATIITAAARPSSPAGPNHVVDLIIATVIGLLVAIGTAFARDRFDDRLRAPQEFDEFGGGPVLAVIPAVRPGRGAARNALVMVRSPESAAAHAYQDLRTRVFRAASQRSAKTLLVTSPAGDRQTIVAANLAIALTRAGQRVVLVCADLRWPHGHELFGEYNAAGLASVVEGRTDLSDALRATDVPRLKVLPAGWLEGDYGAALQSTALRQVIGQLRGSAEFVIIDAPPALAGADTGALAELAEMVLLVGDARRTTRRQASATVEQVKHVSARVIGCVIDNFGRRTRSTGGPVVPVPVDPATGEPPNGHAEADWLLDTVAIENVSKA